MAGRAALAAAACWLAVSQGWAQQTGNQQQAAGQSALSALANQQGGLQGTGSGLSQRFQSNFQRFLSGQQQIGQVVGANAPSFAQQTGQTGATGTASAFRGGNLFNSLFSPFGLGAFGRTAFGRGLNTTTQTQTNQPNKLARTRLVIGFTARAPAPTEVSQRLATRFTRISQFKDSAEIRVLMEGRTAVLQGRVASEHQRELAERLAMLEPGIEDVRNELTVRSAESSDEAATDATPSTGASLEQRR